MSAFIGLIANIALGFGLSIADSPGILYSCYGLATLPILAYAAGLINLLYAGIGSIGTRKYSSVKEYLDNWAIFTLVIGACVIGGSMLTDGFKSTEMIAAKYGFTSPVSLTYFSHLAQAFGCSLIWYVIAMPILYWRQKKQQNKK